MEPVQKYQPLTGLRLREKDTDRHGRNRRDPAAPARSRGHVGAVRGLRAVTTFADGVAPDDAFADGQPGGTAGEPLLSLARRRWRLIAVVTAAGGLGTLLACQALTPLYTSSAAVMIDPRAPKHAATADPLAFMPPSEESVRKNEMALIRSRTVAERVAATLGLEQDPEFNRSLRPSRWQGLARRARSAVGGLPAILGLSSAPVVAEAPRPASVRDQVINRVLDRLTTIPTEATRVIEVRFQSERPQMAATVVAAVVAQYAAQRREQGQRDAQAAIDVLDGEIEAVNQRVRGAERAIQRMQQESGRQPAVEQKVFADQLSDLTRQLSAATGERTAQETRLARIEATRNAPRGSNTAGAAVGSSLIQQLQTQAAQAAARLSGVAVAYPPNHPRVREAKAQLDALNAAVDAEMAKLGTSLRNDLAVATAKEAVIARMIENVRSEMTRSVVSENEIRLLERKSEANRNLANQLVSRLTGARSDLQLPAAEARIISPATVPVAPSFPPTLAMMAVGLAVSATGGGLLAMLCERRDRSIRTAAQLRRLTSAHLLGSIPSVPRRSWTDRAAPPAAVLARPTSLLAENLRAVWLQFDRSRMGEKRILLVTSALPGEGKSSIATALARVLAAGGRRVVVIDADLRVPSVHRLLSVRRCPGLAELTAGTATMDEVIQLDRNSGAFVIAAGQPVASPADTLQSPEMASILLQLRTMFDGIIIDTPPVLAVADAGILACHADLTALVVRWGATKQASVCAALQRLRDFEVQAGVILAQVDGRKAAYYGYEDADMFARAMRKYQGG